MGRNSSSPPAILDDNGGADLGFHSIRDRFPFKRNPNPIHQRDRPRGLFTDRQPFPRPPPRSHHRFYRKGLLCLFPFKGKSAFYAVLIFALFVFAVATMLLQSSMTLVFRQGSERGRLLREGLKFGSTLRFMPGRVSKRVVEGDGLDRARNEARIGVRPPRLALILGNMKKDPQSLMLITVMKNIKKLGYKLKYRCWILNNYSTLGSGPHIDLLAGAAAGGTSVLCTYPLDLARTKLAYQVVNTRGNINCGMKGTHHQIVYKGIRDVLSSVYKEGGFRGLYRGVGPTLTGILPYAGLKFYIYEELKLHVPEEYEKSIVMRLSCGALAGLFGQTLTYPLDVVRRQMQVENLHSSDQGGVRYRNTMDGLKYIIRNQGWKKLFSGLSVNYIKIVPSVAIGFTAYDTMKGWLHIPPHRKAQSMTSAA